MANEADDKKVDPKQAEAEKDPKAEKKVFCVRNQMEKGAPEHLGCAYCFGKRREVIENGERKEFCDFDPDKDPTSFGFPENTSRNLKG